MYIQMHLIWYLHQYPTKTREEETRLFVSVSILHNAQIIIFIFPLSSIW